MQINPWFRRVYFSADSRIIEFRCVCVVSSSFIYLLTLSVKVNQSRYSGPEGSRKFRFPDYITTAQDGGKVISFTHRPPLPPGNAPGTHFC